MVLTRLPAAGRLGLLLQVLAELAAVPPGQVLVLSPRRGPYEWDAVERILTIS
jgi:hypothetical protein